MPTPPGEHDRRADAELVARTICLRMLTTAPRTRAQLAAEMARRGVGADVAAGVLERLGAVGLVDDQAYAASWADSRLRQRGAGRRMLEGELRRRGVGSGEVTAALAGISAEQERQAARRLVERRLPTMRDLDPVVRERRLFALLARRGHEADGARAVIRDVTAAHEPDVPGSCDPC
ncbi:MAG: regulatory protein RecX [Actinomycetes bacterium]